MKSELEIRRRIYGLGMVNEWKMVELLEWVLDINQPNALQLQMCELAKEIKEVRKELHMHERGWQHEN